MGIDSRTMAPGNFPNATDTTAELVRKHKLYRAEMQRIFNDEIQRGKDYWGGYDDSIANDVSEIEERLYDRASMQFDLEATMYIHKAPVQGHSYCIGKLRVAADALDALNAGDLDKARQLLESIRPDYPTDTDDGSEEGDTDA